MSSLPLTGLKILDLAPTPEGRDCLQALGLWGGECLLLPTGLDRVHPEGSRILLLLVQEVDVLLASDPLEAELSPEVLHEYNPRLIVCHLAAKAPSWAAVSAVMAALRHRDATGLGQTVEVRASGTPRFSAFTPAPDLPHVAPEQFLGRLGYDAPAIAALRRDGIL